ncbi:hypothetical protein [Pseudomonas sp. TE3610]
MAIRLDKLPPPALRPAAPNALRWAALLGVLLLVGLAKANHLATQTQEQDWRSFIGFAVVLPVLLWSLCFFTRTLIYVGQRGMADGWDSALDERRARLMRFGRRSQQVLAVSWYTALHEPDDGDGRKQLGVMLNDQPSLKAQTIRDGALSLRHTRLQGESEGPEEALLQAMQTLLTDLAPTLAKLPADTPLAVLLELNTTAAPELLQHLWQTAWATSGIGHPIETLDGSGLSVVDEWLDQRIDDPALLLVIALQVAPPHPEGTGEAAVGVLLGNRLTQATLPPIAYLHRPQQERGAGQASLAEAARQALDWVPLPAIDIERTWCTGIVAQRSVALNRVIKDLALTPDQRPCCPDALLGNTGLVAPWLAVAAATQAITCGAGPQFIFSGEGPVNTRLWCSAVMPGPSPLR